MGGVKGAYLFEDRCEHELSVALAMASVEEDDFHGFFITLDISLV